jgi:hypothetical protein
MSKKSKSKRTVQDGVERVEKENHSKEFEKQKERQKNATLGGV